MSEEFVRREELHALLEVERLKFEQRIDELEFLIDMNKFEIDSLKNELSHFRERHRSSEGKEFLSQILWSFFKPIVIGWGSFAVIAALLYCIFR